MDAGARLEGTWSIQKTSAGMNAMTTVLPSKTPCRLYAIVICMPSASLDARRIAEPLRLITRCWKTAKRLAKRRLTE